jgi:hypothetical protein
MQAWPLLARAFAAAVLLFAGGTARAESVFVKYRGELDLAPFACQDVTSSSLVFRVCYDAPNQYMLISLKGTYYHYCGIDPSTVSNLMAADSMGRFYNARIKGHFDCRQGGIPPY